MAKKDKNAAPEQSGVHRKLAVSVENVDAAVSAIQAIIKEHGMDAPTDALVVWYDQTAAAVLADDPKASEGEVFSFVLGTVLRQAKLVKGANISALIMVDTVLKTHRKTTKPRVAPTIGDLMDKLEVPINEFVTTVVAIASEVLGNGQSPLPARARLIKAGHVSELISRVKAIVSEDMGSEF